VLFARSRTHDLSLVYRLIIILLIKILSGIIKSSETCRRTPSKPTAFTHVNCPERFESIDSVSRNVCVVILTG
jgi:hypothetical protein